jgi:hypothetical protein
VLPDRHPFLDEVDQGAARCEGLGPVPGRHGCGERDVPDAERADPVQHSDADLRVLFGDGARDRGDDVTGARVPFVVEGGDTLAPVVVADDPGEGDDGAVLV